uniref:Uncharacterized protein n=1 Tax=Rhizophora mucronata TaxID=61149 RepID=A0A2P2QLN4_RHIMU
MSASQVRRCKFIWNIPFGKKILHDRDDCALHSTRNQLYDLFTNNAFIGGNSTGYCSNVDLADIKVIRIHNLADSLQPISLNEKKESPGYNSCFEKSIAVKDKEQQKQ